MELIQQLGFLPLLASGISGYSAEEMADEECRYIVFPDGGWDWPLWKWKGIIINESDCVYGKFFNGKEACIIDCPPEESYRLMNDHLHAIPPHASDKQISKLLR